MIFPFKREINAETGPLRTASRTITSIKVSIFLDERSEGASSSNYTILAKKVGEHGKVIVAKEGLMPPIATLRDMMGQSGENPAW